MDKAHNLNDNVNDAFEFTVDNYRYSMSYPTQEEADALLELIVSSSGTVGTERKAKNDDLLGQIYGRVSKLQDDAPDLREYLKTKNIQLTRKFNTLWMTEFGFNA